MRREWAMPSADTFSIVPVADLLDLWLPRQGVIVDPFARNSSRGTVTNDLDASTTAQHHMDALDFARMVRGQGVRAAAVLFDPPYSPRQITDHYRAAGRTATKADTQSSFYRLIRDELDALLLPGGVAISAGWSSTGFGVERGYRLRELLLVAHGGAHNDTIVTIETKEVEQLQLAATGAEVAAGRPPDSASPETEG